MGLTIVDGFDRICSGQAALLWMGVERQFQHHVDVIGKHHEVTAVFDWCAHTLGRPAAWLPLQEDAQWYNRFETDIARFSDRAWSFQWSPWVGGDVENVHLIFEFSVVASFREQWHSAEFALPNRQEYTPRVLRC